MIFNTFKKLPTNNSLKNHMYDLDLASSNPLSVDITLNPVT